MIEISQTFGIVTRLQGCDPVVVDFGIGGHDVPPFCGWLRKDAGWQFFEDCDYQVEIIGAVVDCG